MDPVDKLLFSVPLSLLPPLYTNRARRVYNVFARKVSVAHYREAEKTSPAVPIEPGEQVCLHDGATKGALLELARRLWEDQYLVAVPYQAALADDWRWRIEAPEADVGELYDYATEEEALVEAVIEGRERQVPF